ncbi:DUF421 domain-containing protein [Natranaerobius trueperi]|uniref:YetF C-terminal domain-containing protein n=1 Tax=Natranaerobius trueperi TaxID=759412 RepID=A0A226BXQ9_9FIRM|nr:DUF421 domain-containing protein [Natranaerobius trueperi]OWZ83786.1 hypothetical protein CDO51_06750 [Natranaerobius trueperi]
MELGDLWQLLVRSITTVFFLWVFMVLIGRRLMGELSVFDFVIAITIGNIAGADLPDLSIPHIPTLISIILLGGILRLTNIGIMHSPWLNRMVTFSPTVVIQEGVILKDNLKKLMLRVDDVLPMLRKQGIFNLNEIDSAVLEPTGNLSVKKKCQFDTTTKKDLNISTVSTKINSGFPLVIVLDGTVEDKSLKLIGKSENWLKTELEVYGVTDISKVFLAVLNSDGSWYITQNTSTDELPNINVKI